MPEPEGKPLQTDLEAAIRRHAEAVGAEPPRSGEPDEVVPPPGEPDASPPGAPALQSLADQLRQKAVEREELYLQKLREEVSDLKSDRAFREQFAPRVFSMVSWWLAGIGVLVLMHGCEDRREFPQNAHEFTLPTEVLVTMISGVSLAVVGLLATVLVYLFPKREKGSSEQKDG